MCNHTLFPFSSLILSSISPIRRQLLLSYLPRSNFKVADLAGKSVDDLKNIRGTLDAAMPPRVNGVRFGVRGADLSDREKGLTVGDLSIVTAAKRKAA